MHLYFSEYSAVGIRRDERACETPVMIFPFEKRINTELLCDRTASLYIVKDSDQSWNE